VSDQQPLDLTIPELRTERLRLRGWRDSDLDAYAAIAADEETMRWIGGMQSRPTAWRTLALYAGHWALRGYGLWAVEHGGELVGRVGLWRPEGWPGLELGWLLARNSWGNGFATEAAIAAMAWGWEHLGAERLISLIDPGNARSLRVAERLGMREIGSTTLGETRVHVYGIEPPASGGDAPQRQS
jgi:RimJ/RimL family protein N-acetyltransferase